MKLPKFWRDTGAWNDTVVAAGDVVGLLIWGGVAWWTKTLWLVGLGLPTGFCLGVGMVAILCGLFTAPKAPPGEPAHSRTGPSSRHPLQ